jgi:hypothetical protein
MKMNCRTLGFLTFALIAGPMAALAQGIVTIDPNAFSAGQDVSLATPGVQLQAISIVPNPNPTSPGFTYMPQYSDVYVQTEQGGTPVGANFFSPTDSAVPSPQQISWGEAEAANSCLENTECDVSTAALAQLPVLRINFSTPTDYLSALSLTDRDDEEVIFAFNSAGQLLGDCFGPSSNTPGLTCGETVVSPIATNIGWYADSITTSTPDISYALVGGLGNVKPIGEIQFAEIVPEIDTTSAASGLTLLFGGLLSLSTRRAKTSTKNS